MALKLVVDSIDEIDETQRSLYVEKDGKYRLDVDGVEDVSGLKNALNSERGARGALEKKVKGWEKLGKTPEEIEALLQQHNEAEAERLKKAGDFDGILKQHQDKWEKEKSALQAERDTALTSERQAVIETRLLAALSGAEVTAEGADLLPDRLTGRIKFEVREGKRVLTIMSADGVTPLAGTGKDGLATFDDLVKEAREKWPSLFKGHGASGGGKPANNGAAGSSVSKKSDFKSEAERSAYVDKYGLDAYKRLPD